MKHARSDYNNLKNLDLKIPENEPVFLLRAQDCTAAETVEYWATLQKDSYLKEIALRHAARMRQWPVKKWADCPESEWPNDLQLNFQDANVIAEIEEELQEEENVEKLNSIESAELAGSYGVANEVEEEVDLSVLSEDDFDDDEDEEDEEFPDEDNETQDNDDPGELKENEDFAQDNIIEPIVPEDIGAEDPR